MIKTDTIPQGTGTHFSNVLLTGTLLLANANVSGLLDYSVKAFIGGAIWLGYKVVADYLETKKQSKKK